MSEFTVRAGRADDASAVARIDVASWRQTYRGIVPDAVLDALDVDEIAAQMRGRLRGIAAGAGSPLACGFVVEDEQGEVVGYVFAGPTRPLQNGAPAPSAYDSEVYALYLAPGYERRGLGARLAHAAASHLDGAGARAVIIWALAQNPNRGFYAAMGGVVVHEQLLTIGGKQLRELGFGWASLENLIAHATRGRASISESEA